MKSRALPVLALLLLPAPAAAQISRNAKLLAQFRPIQATNYYNDIWGYVAGGREHAILGVSNGTYFIDCSVPSSLKVRAMISYSAGGSGWRPSGWRDIKSYGSYAYIVTEGGGGMQIVDLRNPLAPTIVKTWGGSIWTHAHNIAMDQENGIAYVCGTSSVIGAHVIDVKTDPVNPKLITSYRGSYVHDLHIQQGYAHLAEIYTNLYRIIDVSKLPSIRSVAAVRTTGLRYAHATWATWDTNYCLTTNEAAGGPIGVWDIRTKTSPRLIASYTAGPASAIPHNVFIRDRVGHFSYYTEGYRSVDLSDPSKPVEVAWYDTWPNASSGYNGNWGCYPFSPSGTIYASDRTYGMFVIKPKSAVAYYGGDTKGSGVPEIHGFGAAFLGNQNFKVELRGGKASSLAILLIGTKKASQSVAGLNLNVDVTSQPLILLTLPTDASGGSMAPLPVPSSPAFNNTTLYMQYLVSDSAGPLGFSATKGMEVELFTR